MMTVKLTAAGFLPEGVHQQAWADFVAQFGFSPRRHAILRRVVVALHHLAAAGVTRVFVGGSFVTAKQSPKDMDVLIDTTDANAALVHPMSIDLHAGRIATLSLFGAEFFPMWLVEASTDEPFVDFFQHTRDGRLVGLIEIDLTTLPERG